MSVLAIALFVIGILACLVGAIMLIVAAFRVSIVWGILSFLGIGQLLFLITHWEESKKGFMVNLFGCLVAYGALTSFGEASVSKQAERWLADRSGSSKHFADGDGEDPAREMTINEIEVELRSAEADLAATQQKTKVDFNDLMAQRAKLGKDEASLAAYNTAVADYEAQNALLPAKAQRVTALRQAADTATQAELEAARAAKKNGGKAPSPFSAMFSAPKKAAAAANAAKANTRGEVVMYTTKTCPACTAAKAYFAKRHVQYREIDVQSDAKGMEEFRKLGGSGVPLIMVNGEKMEGFNEKRLEAALGGSA
jgi:glutaredoxin